MPSKWCGETFSHYFKDGTVLHCQITDTSFTNSPVCSSKRARRSVEETPQDVKISSDYFDKVSNSEQSQHLGKRYGIALADGSGCYANFFQTRDLTNLFFALVRLRGMCKTCPIQPLSSTLNFLF